VKISKLTILLIPNFFWECDFLKSFSLIFEEVIHIRNEISYPIMFPNKIWEQAKLHPNRRVAFFSVLAIEKK